MTAANHHVPEPATIDEWLETRPTKIRALAQRFPFDAVYDFLGRPHFLLGFSDTVRFKNHDHAPMLILTPVNPALDYSGARDARIYVAVEHFETPPGTRH